MQTRHKIINLSTTSPLALTYEDNVQSSYTLVVQNNNDSGFIYIGSSMVSSSSYGYKLFPGHAFTIELSAFNRLYAVSSAAAMTAALLVVERAI